MDRYVKFRFKLYPYIKENTSPVSFADNVSEHRCLHQLSFAAQNVCGLLLDKNVDIVDQSWNLPDKSIVEFDNEIIFEFECDPELDPYLENDIYRCNLSDSNYTGHLVSRYIVNDTYTFYDVLDMIQFVAYYLDHDCSVAEGFDISRFQSNWIEDQKLYAQWQANHLS